MTVRENRGRTFATYYATEGLLAKSCDGARLSDLAKPTPYLVAAHIGYEAGGPDEARSRNYSPLLSFSTERDAVLHFVDRTNKKTFESTEIESATHFIWRLDVDGLSEETPGCYRLRYFASTRNVDQFLEAKIARVRRGDEGSIVGAVATQLVHANLKQDTSEHQALIIDPLRYLPATAGEPSVPTALREKALELARKWSEWLVYPIDPGPEGRGFSGRFVLNDRLDVDSLYREAG